MWRRHPEADSNFFARENNGNKGKQLQIVWKLQIPKCKLLMGQQSEWFHIRMAEIAKKYVVVTVQKTYRHARHDSAFPQ